MFEIHLDEQEEEDIKEELEVQKMEYLKLAEVKEWDEKKSTRYRRRRKRSLGSEDAEKELEEQEGVELEEVKVKL